MPGADKQTGFTILEALVAFAILALFLSILYETLQGSMSRSERAKSVAHAVLIAESQLDLVRATGVAPSWNKPAPIAGTRFSISFASEQLDEPNSSYAHERRPRLILATVLWNEFGTKRSLSIQTIVALKRGQAE